MRVLVITFTFPPSSHANAKRPYYLVKGMLDAGWKVDVLTSRIGMGADLAETITDSNCRITRVFDPMWAISTLFGAGTRWERLVNLLGNGVIWPESCRLWAMRVFAMARGGVSGYDRVIAFVFPPSVLLSGSIPGLVDNRWVFDMQESVSPQYALYPRRSPLQKLLTPRLRRAEGLTLHRAGKVVFTAETNRNAYIEEELVPPERTELIPHFFDARVFSEPGIVSGDFTIGYFGYFDLRGVRTPETFLRALHGFLVKRPEAREKTRFLFHGSWLPAHNTMLDKLGLWDVAQIKSSVPLDEYLELVKSCPVLLLLTAAKLNLFMPSKVVEYLGASRPILAFVPPDSEVAGVLKRSGMDGFVCGEHDVAAGVLAIERLWEMYVGGSLDAVAEGSRHWSSEVQIPRYLELLEGMRIVG